MSNVIMETVSKLTEVTPQPEDFVGEDGLLYCGKCRTPKQQYFPEWARIPGMDRHPVDCDCEKVQRLKREAEELRRKHRAAVEERRRHCFSNGRMTSWNFENDNGNTPQMDYARRYVQNWDKVQSDNIGYYLWGDPDSGKSFLAACIANGLLEKEVSVRMTNFTAILNDLSERFEGRNDYIEYLCRYPLLIIDDLGTERGTEYALEHVYNVIDSRYRSGKPLILTANISPDVLNNPPDMAHARIYSRILEMCVPIHVTGVQNRKATAQRKMDTLKSMMNESSSDV